MSASAAQLSLAVCVPVFNEGKQIERSLETIVAAFQGLPARTTLIAVDDGSSDESGDIAARMASQSDSIDFVCHASNQGYGGACRSGAAWAADNGFGYVAFMDSDLTNPPEDLAKVATLAAAGADYVKASRYLPGGGMDGVPLRRQVFSRSGRRVGSALFGLHGLDVTNGFRAVRTDLYRSWPLHEDGFPIIMEEVYWAQRSGVEIVSFPTVLRSREGDLRDTSFVYTPRVFREYLRYPLRSFGDRHQLSRPPSKRL